MFWIPTIYHQKIHPLQDKQEIKDEDISDAVGFSCKLTLKLEEENSIQVDLFFEEEKDNLSFSLNKTEDHRNGFFVYKFNVDEQFHKIVQLALVNPIYHYAKGFYHEHQYHSNDCDSILDAYVEMDIDELNINCPDNKPLIFYLQQYEKRFKDFVDQLEYDAKYLEDSDNNPDNKDVLYRHKYDEFNQHCIDILGEVIYYRTLFYSKHNHSYRVDHYEVPKDECKCDSNCPSKDRLCELYKSALNTENAITRIKLITERVKSISQNKRANATLVNIKAANNVLRQLSDTTEKIQNLQESVQETLVLGNKSSKLSLNLGYLGGFLGFISIALAIIPFLKDDGMGEIKKNQNIILKKLDSIEQKTLNLDRFQIMPVDSSGFICLTKEIQ